MDGVIINRKVDEGQTVAASFQTPELFIVAPDLSKMHIHATVDEADIGLITEAWLTGLPVTYSVDSFPEEPFRGKIFQVRQNSTTTQNVVTYPVIVKTDNPVFKVIPGLSLAMGSMPPHLRAQDVIRKLKPGMTANLSFQVKERPNALRIPNSALRFYPPQKNLVHADDQHLLEGSEFKSEDDDGTPVKLTAREKVEAHQKLHYRHVWVIDEETDLLRAVKVRVGISDNKFTEVLSSELREGQELVTGIKARE